MLKNLFWDSCIFIRYITNDVNADHFDDISRFVDDAKAGKRQIYYSTISLVEFKQEYFDGSRFGSIRDFFDDMGSACLPIDPNPNVMFSVGELRSAKSTNPGDPRKTGRPIATPDAIIMMSAIYARDALGISDIVLHQPMRAKAKAGSGEPFLSLVSKSGIQSRHVRNGFRKSAHSHAKSPNIQNLNYSEAM